MISTTLTPQRYLNLAEQRTEAARQESVESAAEVDDLDNLNTPEMIMLSAVSGEDAQDRSDRKILMPWVKFLWESYCQCLELLRTNIRVERLYHDIAQQAFRFCLKYQRKTEFRKLCDKLRNHLDLVQKQTPSQMSINLNNADTQQMNLDTRLVQLDAAIQMELWQEAYKAVEDIHGLMSLSKKVFQPKMMANYYQKLALVFWKSGNFLFHAAAVFKHFQLTREMKKNISAEELAKMASRVLAACLCVPLPSQHPEFDRFIETDRSPAEKMARLAVLLALNQPPTRLTLLKDCVRFGVVAGASQELRDLYNWLEVDFHPLSVCRKVDERLKMIEEQEDFAAIKQYTEPFRDMTLIRLLKQVAQVYQSVSMDRLIALSVFSDRHHMERLIVECARNNDMQVRIDHRTSSVHFGTDLAESQKAEVAEGPHVQAMPSEQVRTQLINMFNVLNKSLDTINPDRLQIETAELKTKITEAYHQSKVRDHQRLLARHKIIEERKEWLETINTAKMEESQKQQRDELLKQKQEEAKRLAVEREIRDKERREQELKSIQAKHNQDKIKQLAQTDIGKKVLGQLDQDTIAQMDADDIMAKQVEELEKEKKELQVRLKAQEKKQDHIERAKRLEELPLLKTEHEELKEEAKKLWAEQEKERIEDLKTNRENDVINRDRMARMREDKDKYLTNLLKERKSVYEKKAQEHQALVEEERKVRLEKRKEERQEDRRRRWRQEKEEEEQRRRDEIALREREEREAREAEAREREREEYERKRAVTEAEEADVEVGGTIGLQGATLLHEVVVVDGGTEGDLHQGEEDLRHDAETLLQGEVDLLLNDLGCSLLQGLSAGQVEQEVVDGESARGRRRNPGVPAAEMAIDPQGGTHLLAEGLHREGAHLREGAALHAGMKDEAMLEVGDAEVGLHQEEVRHRGVGLLPGGVLHLAEDLLLGVDHHHEEVPLQDVVEVLTTEVVPGGQDLGVGMIVARLGEALRRGGVLPQGEAPHLAEARL